MPVYSQTVARPKNNGGAAYKDGGCSYTIDLPRFRVDPMDNVCIILGPSGRNDECQFQCPVSLSGFNATVNIPSSGLTITTDNGPILEALSGVIDAVSGQPVSRYDFEAVQLCQSGMDPRCGFVRFDSVDGTSTVYEADRTTVAPSGASPCKPNTTTSQDYIIVDCG